MTRAAGRTRPCAAAALLTLGGCTRAPAPPPQPDDAALERKLHWVEGRTAGPDDPLVVVIHGYGDSPEGILPLLSSHPEPITTRAPRAPDRGGSGWSWFPIGALEQDPSELCQWVQTQADAVAHDLQSWHEPGRPTVVTGFSQGGMVTAQLALRHPDLVDLAVPLGGFVPSPCASPGAPPPDAPVVRALHGAEDTRLPPASMQAFVTGLKQAGWDAEIALYDRVGHSVSPPMRAELTAQILGAARR